MKRDRDYYKQHLPNWLTISRVAVVLPICVLMVFFPTPLGFFIACVFASYAMVTDYFDGYLSRRWHVTSDFGRLLDPIADKLLIAALLILLTVHGYGHPLAVILIMLREITVSALREFTQAKGVTLHVTTMAKYKTTFQMVAAFALLISAIFPNIMVIDIIAEVLLWTGCVLTCYTGYDYFKAAMRQCVDKPAQSIKH
jgi:cardiolipin synthase (CMP-forming)